MTSSIIHDPNLKNGVNIESKTENRVDIGSKLTKSIAKLVNSLIFYVKKTRFAPVFDHRKITNSQPNRLNFFFKPRQNLRRTRILKLKSLDDKWTCRISTPDLSFFAVFRRFSTFFYLWKDDRIEVNFFLKTLIFSRRIRFWPKKRGKLNRKMSHFFHVIFDCP
jgi:hypothetical protein